MLSFRLYALIFSCNFYTFLYTCLILVDAVTNEKKILHLQVWVHVFYVSEQNVYYTTQKLSREEYEIDEY